VKAKLLIANHLLLFLCASMYLGTGGSLVFFTLPTVVDLTPDNYYSHIIPELQNATAFLTPMTKVMLACGSIMLIAEWRQPMRWVPIIVLISVVAATALTVYGIFPLNREMAAHIQDAQRLREVLAEWIPLSRLRFAFWCVEWAGMGWYFARWALRGRYPDWARGA
jgi:uncharacterized membrane protein